MSKIRGYRDLKVWNKSMNLVRHVYNLTREFPKAEQYGLVSQMRRAAVSVPSNIAEGKSRGHRKEYRHFLLNSFGSGAELETQMEIAKHLPECKHLDFSEVDEHLVEVMKMLNVLIDKLK